MRMPLFRLLLILTAVMSSAPAQEVKPPLNREAANDPALFQSFSVPRTWWLSDNTALILDPAKPAAERQLERLDPATGKRTPFMDMAKAKSAYEQLYGDGAPHLLPSVPSQFSADGKRALYMDKGDIFVLDVPSLTFTRVTSTPEAEKNVNFSPDGQRVAYVREKNLYAYDLSAKKEYTITSDGGGTILNATLSWVYWEEIFGRVDVGYWWSKDSKALAFLRTDESKVTLQRYVDIAPWSPTVTEQRYPKVGEPNPDVKVGIAEVGSGSIVWAGIDPALYEYIIRVDWVPDNKRVMVRTLNRLQTKLDFVMVDRVSGKASVLLTDSNDGWINMSDDLFFLKDGKHMIISSERDGNEHLYRYTMQGKLVNQITKGPWSVRTSGGGAFWVRQAVSGIDEDNGWVYFTALERSSVERHFYRIRMDGSKMTRLSETEGTHAITMSPNARYYFDRHSSITTPPSLTLVDASKNKRSVLSASNLGGFAKYDVVYPELMWIPMRDGFKVPASIVRPKNADPNKKYPVIVQVYGGPSAPTVANSWGFDVVEANAMLHDGYVTFKVDNRAATGISKTLENLLHKRTPGEIELNDLVDAVRWLKQQPGIDPDRFGITGWSGGGTNTLLAMTQSKEFKAGIAGGAVTDFRFYDSKWGEALMQTEAENKDGFDKVSLLNYAKDLHGKLLLIHGLHDDNVHIQNIWRFIDELIKANKVFELMVYPMRGHGVGDPAGRKHMQTLTLDFWKRNL